MVLHNGHGVRCKLLRCGGGLGHPQSTGYVRRSRQRREQVAKREEATGACGRGTRCVALLYVGDEVRIPLSLIALPALSGGSARARGATAKVENACGDVVCRPVWTRGHSASHLPHALVQPSCSLVDHERAGGQRAKGATEGARSDVYVPSNPQRLRRLGLTRPIGALPHSTGAKPAHSQSASQDTELCLSRSLVRSGVPTARTAAGLADCEWPTRDIKVKGRNATSSTDVGYVCICVT